MTRAVGVDVGGTKTAAGVVDDRGRILERAETRSGPGSAEAFRAAVTELLGRLDMSGVEGVGIGAAGLIDFAAARYLYGPNTGLRELDLPGIVSEASGLPTWLDNDANCAAWAEHRFGAGRGTLHFLCVTFGTGIGGGFVLDGRPYRGAHGGAAEIGHMLVEADGVLCGCGRRGCWEQYASGQALERIAREGLHEEPDSVLSKRSDGDPAALAGRMVTAAAREGDAFAQRVVERIARWMGLGLASLVNIFEPERIAISGGLVSDWDLLEDRAVTTMVDRVEAADRRPMPEVVPAELGADAGLVGAAWLALEGAR